MANYFYSPYKHKLGNRLASDCNSIFNYYDGRNQAVKNMLGEDIEAESEISRHTRRILEKLENLTRDCAGMKATESIEKQVDELLYFTRHHGSDVYRYLRLKEEKNEVKPEEEKKLVELCLIITEGFEDILFDYYPKEKTGEFNLMIRSKVQGGSSFWKDSRWQKVLTEMNEYVEEKDYRKKREEIIMQK